jgi:toxin ParE1/3/4
MKRYKVKITDRALADMEAVYDYIADELLEPGTAMKQYNRIAEAIESLSTFPERCMLLESEPEHSMGMRQLLIDHYSAFYIVGEVDVTVLRVLYSASDFNAKLCES